MQTQHILGPSGNVRDGVQVQIRCVRRQNRAGARKLIETTEDVLLDAHFLERGLNHQIGTGNAGPVIGRPNAAASLIGRGGGEAPALHLAVVEALHAVRAGSRGVRVLFEQVDRDTRVRQGHGDARAHRASANHGDPVDRSRSGALQPRHLGRLAFGQEQMPQRPRCRRLPQPQEGGALALQARGERVTLRCPHDGDRLGDRRHALGALYRGGGSRVFLGWIGIRYGHFREAALACGGRRRPPRPPHRPR